jgi:hypothetical protein
MKRRAVGVFLGMILFSLFAKIIIANARIQAIDNLDEGTSGKVQSFRLLAVEGISGFSTRTRSGQYFIEELLRYANWNNCTQEYVSHVHLLSNFAYDEVSGVAKPFFVGDLTRDNLRGEIVDFLGGAEPNETVVFYYSGNGEKLGLTLGEYPDSEVVNSTELVGWLGSGGLSEASVCIVLDTCYAGSWIDDGSDLGGVLGSGRFVLAACTADQLSAALPPDVVGVFTGNMTLGLGILGALCSGNDSNGDGWMSFEETFTSAKASVEQYMNNSQNPVSYNGLGFDPPFAFRSQPPVADFSFNPERPCVNRSILMNGSASYSKNGEITEYLWDFGDGSKATVSEPLVNHTYVSPGKYIVTLEVTDNNAEANSTTRTIMVYLLGDLNKDGAVNIQDIGLAAEAFRTRLGEEKWDSIADVNEDGMVNIVDIAIIAREYGEVFQI